MRRNSILLLFVSVEPEPNHPKPDLRRVTYAELYALVADLVSAFLARGLKPGDRIASYASNCIVRMRTFDSSVLRPLRFALAGSGTTCPADTSETISAYMRLALQDSLLGVPQ